MACIINAGNVPDIPGMYLRPSKVGKLPLVDLHRCRDLGEAVRQRSKKDCELFGLNEKLILRSKQSAKLHLR